MRWSIRGIVVLAAVVLGTAIGLRGDDSNPAAADQKKVKRLLMLSRNEAESYTIYRDSARRKKLELRKEPVYVWTNVIRNGGQNGAVFVWTYRGRPEVVGSFHSNLADQDASKRAITHEFHSLSPDIVYPERDGPHRWQPKAGIVLKPIPNAPKPADSPRQRLFQMREMARDFSAHSIDDKKQTWQLRLLTQPLFRYETTDPEVIDGALFGFVTSAGTDPEVIILLEAREGQAGPEWRYSVCRFSDLDLYVKHKDLEIWTSVRGGENVQDHDPQHLYRLIFDRRIDELPDDQP
jgi:hypothetical protein